MGVYMNDKMNIIEKLAEALDDIEGDFTQKSLFEALEILKKYPYVCDKRIHAKSWRQMLLTERKSR